MAKEISRFETSWLMHGLVCLAVLPASPWAQTSWTYPGCPAVTDADFKVDTLVRRGIAPDPQLAEPVKMAFDMDAEGNVDVYFTEVRPGNIKRYNGKTRTVTTLAKLPVWTGPYSSPENNKGPNVEEGATGIALDPGFRTNGWIYIHWSPASQNVFRISRFKVANNAINLADEKIILQFESQRAMCCHTGGAMAFDAYGDLWIAQGANGGNVRGRMGTTAPIIGIDEAEKFKSEEWGASSTKGLRGGFLRIRPTPEGKYTIPAGNFGEYFYNQTKDARYLDTGKVAPEIYIKGTRNNYSMALDPVKRWVFWGDVGPDELTAVQREEFNLRKTPGFEGWPYFVGNNLKFAGNQDPAAPVNNSKWNAGLTALPPARPATRLPDAFMREMRRSPISGPLYLYDGDLQSQVKLPPHFNRKWFVTDYTNGRLFVFDLSEDGEQVTGFKPLLSAVEFKGPVDFRQGPDGALYIINYGFENFTTSNNTSIMRIRYTGTCRPPEPKLEAPSGLTGTRFDQVFHRSGFLVNLGLGSLVKVPQGMSGLELFGMTGKKVWGIGNLKPEDAFRLPSDLRGGAFKYRWITR